AVAVGGPAPGCVSACRVDASSTARRPQRDSRAGRSLPATPPHPILSPPGGRGSEEGGKGLPQRCPASAQPTRQRRARGGSGCRCATAGGRLLSSARAPRFAGALPVLFRPCPLCLLPPPTAAPAP